MSPREAILEPQQPTAAAIIIHRTEADGEWAYDRQSAIGRLEKAVDGPPRRGWTIVDVRRGWKAVFPFERP